MKLLKIIPKNRIIFNSEEPKKNLNEQIVSNLSSFFLHNNTPILPKFESILFKVIKHLIIKKNLIFHYHFNYF